MMTTPTTYDFTTLVKNQIAAIQGAATALVDTSIGSIVRSMVESNSAVVLWLQGLILQLLATTRAATSSGSDLDSWFADFGFSRLSASAATNNSILFSRFTPTNQATVAVGTVIASNDGTQLFTVIADTNQSAYNPTLLAYILPAGTASATTTVQANTPGSAGNLAAGQLNTLTQAMPGIDTVTNTIAITNGYDAELDASARSRFVSYLLSLAKATKGAISYAIATLKQGVTSTLVENYTLAGVYQPGYFYAIVDDGTGAPSDPFISSAYAAIDAVRPFTSTFGVFKPTVITANVAMAITTASGYVHATVAATVQAAIVNYINTLGLGNSLSFYRLAQVAYDASPGVLTVTSVTLNSSTSDLTATNQQTIKAGTVTVA